MPGDQVKYTSHPIDREEVLEAALYQGPATARELVQRVRADGLRVSKSQINSMLYASEKFVSDGAMPPRWSVAQAVGTTAGRGQPADRQGDLLWWLDDEGSLL